MKNTVISAFIIFFAVVACLLIIDDLAFKNKKVQKSSQQEINKTKNLDNNIAILDLDVAD